jgi:hypothetical protein
MEQFQHRRHWRSSACNPLSVIDPVQPWSELNPHDLRIAHAPENARYRTIWRQRD